MSAERDRFDFTGTMFEGIEPEWHVVECFVGVDEAVRLRKVHEDAEARRLLAEALPKEG